MYEFVTNNSTTWATSSGWPKRPTGIRSYHDIESLHNQMRSARRTRCAGVGSLNITVLAIRAGATALQVCHGNRLDVRYRDCGDGDAYNSLFTVLSGNPVHDSVYRSFRGGIVWPQNASSGCKHSHLSGALASGENKQAYPQQCWNRKRFSHTLVFPYAVRTAGSTGTRD
jgi:hypothetical protein